LAMVTPAGPDCRCVAVVSASRQSPSSRHGTRLASLPTYPSCPLYLGCLVALPFHYPCPACPRTIAAWTHVVPIIWLVLSRPCSLTSRRASVAACSVKSPCCCALFTSRPVLAEPRKAVAHLPLSPLCRCSSPSS
jgi:hypothetical protein